MPDHADLPPPVRDALRAVRRADTELPRFKAARAVLAIFLEEHPEHADHPELAHVLESADAEFQRRLDAINSWSRSED